MKTSPHITLTKEQDKRETVICIVWASVVVFGMLALMLHGLAYFSSATVTGQDIYAREIMQRKITLIERELKYLENHIHPETNKGFTEKLIVGELLFESPHARPLQSNLVPKNMTTQP